MIQSILTEESKVKSTSGLNSGMERLWILAIKGVCGLHESVKKGKSMTKIFFQKMMRF